ncbi:MAG: hypothetical protein JWM27_1503 [Gemmatimonadetes bacterium]|nr:hypothetical protein [Gemmatimonadota bacterium]
MKTRLFSTLAVAALVSLGACKKDNAGGESSTSDTTTQVVTQPDTQAVVTTTTTSVDTSKVDSTNHGAMTDTTKHDTTKKM